jgi:hypothetical protein
MEISKSQSMLVSPVGASPDKVLQTQSSDDDRLDRKARQPALANDGKAGSPPVIFLSN